MINLILDGTQVTERSIELVRDSKELGSIRDLPQISGRYQIPSSTIRVCVKDTEVKDLPEEPPILKGFHIEYKPPVGRHHWAPVDHAIKIL